LAAKGYSPPENSLWLPLVYCKFPEGNEGILNGILQFSNLPIVEIEVVSLLQPRLMYL